MNIILQHLDEILFFHRDYDEYYRPYSPEGGVPSLFAETEQQIEKYRNIYISERNKSFIRIFGSMEKFDVKYLDRLYEILIEDKYIVQKKDNKIVTLKGRMFEGYIEEEKINQTKNFLNKVQIWAVILGGIIAFVWYSLEIFHKYLIPFLCP